MAAVGTTPPADHPRIEQAEASLRSAYIDLARTMIRAPVTGYVAKRTVQLGQAVQAGMPLLAIVPLDQIWIDANFKETSLSEVRLGQPATVHADFYGGGVTFHGRVAGLSAGTGSAFELLPPENATGNWIKIVRRVPVRIELDPAELDRNPLRTGLSTEVSIDVHDTSGPRLDRRTNPNAPPAYETSVYSPEAKGVDALIDRIVRANGIQIREAADGSPSASGAPPPAMTPAARKAAEPMASDREAGPAPYEGAALALITVALSLATFMNVLDTSIANVSIPAIAGDLGVSPDQGTWVITSFAVANAISVPLTGWLTQRFGQVRLFLATRAALRHRLVPVRPGAVAADADLLPRRAGRGRRADDPAVADAAAVELPAREGRHRRSPCGRMTTLVAPVVGPLLGGWITDNISWPWIFYINVPVGLSRAALHLGHLPQARDADARRLPIDTVGLALLVLWVGALQIMLDKGKDLDWFALDQIIVARRSWRSSPSCSSSSGS